jgi:peptide/nickel transport system substrate-binding protein
MNQKQKGFSRVALLIFLVVVLGIFYFLNNNKSSTEFITIKEISKDNAKQALLSGEIDIYAGFLSEEDIEELSNNSKITLFPSASTVMGMHFNPFPSTDVLNPFSIREVRHAMQFLVDREDLASLFSGFASPIVSVPWDGHPAYEDVRETVEGLEISYNKEKARSLIKDGMESAGAYLEDGLWKHNGGIVDVIISYYDISSSNKIASLLSDSLSDAGFNVIYHINDPDDPNAMEPESYTNASEMKWNIAVSGWVYYNQSKNHDMAIMAPYVESGWWEYKNEEIDELNKSRKDIKTKEESQELNNKLAQKYIEDSTCVWLLSLNNVSAARSEVKGLIQDDFVGIKNYTNIREAYIPGKDTIVIGLPKVYKEEGGWNHFTISGIEMMYIVNTVHDPIIWNKTNTLEEEPFRWAFNIEGDSFDSEINVPEGTFFWNSDMKKWSEVEENEKAVIKVTYDLSKYIDSNWHHEEKITWADIVYNIARVWDSALDKEKQKIDNAWSAEFFESFVGFRIDGQKLEVYLNEWNIEKEKSLNISGIFRRSAPWEIYVATDDLVFNQRAYDYQLSSISGDKIINLFNSNHIDSIFESLERIDFNEIAPMMTMGDNVYANESDLHSRINSLKEWNSNHNHLYISDGPFYIDYLDNDKSMQLRAFRDESYPFKKGNWR